MPNSESPHLNLVAAELTRLRARVEELEAKVAGLTERLEHDAPLAGVASCLADVLNPGEGKTFDRASYALEKIIPAEFAAFAALRADAEALVAKLRTSGASDAWMVRMAYRYAAALLTALLEKHK